MSRALDFILELAWADAPAEVRTKVGLLLRDFAAVSVAGRATQTARLAAEYAATEHPGNASTCLFDRRRAGAAGAAFANGVLANALDFDDGHRLVKGHPGANVIPAALAAGELAGNAEETMLAGIAVGYEVALCAGIALHASAGQYHASGAWGCVGAAAAAARVLALDAGQTAHALGLAEYHAPIAPIMRSVADPAMTKDACGWGAFVGVSSALLAARGFTALAPTLLDDAAATLGERWHVLDVYVKKFPCCRWSHPAIEAALRLRAEVGLEPERLTRIRVRTFTATAALARDLPATTEEAQYSVVWPVAVALAHGRFDVEHVLEPAFADRAARRLARLVEVEVDRAFDAEFPGRRRSALTVEDAAGRSHDSGPVEAPGEADDPGWKTIVEAKAAAYADEALLSPEGPVPYRRSSPSAIS